MRSITERRTDQLYSFVRAKCANLQHADGLIVGQDGLFVAYRKQVTELAAKYRLPAIYRSIESIESGALMAYGPNYSDIYRRAAIYVDKIFKGANPGDLLSSSQRNSN